MGGGSTDLAGLEGLPAQPYCGHSSIGRFVMGAIRFTLFPWLAILGQMRRRLVRVSLTTNPTARGSPGEAPRQNGHVERLICLNRMVVF
jgi:hypothetical protein